MIKTVTEFVETDDNISNIIKIMIYASGKHQVKGLSFWYSKLFQENKNCSVHQKTDMFCGISFGNSILI